MLHANTTFFVWIKLPDYNHVLLIGTARNQILKADEEQTLNTLRVEFEFVLFSVIGDIVNPNVRCVFL